MKSVFTPVDVKINNSPKVWGTNIGESFGDRVEIKNKKIPSQAGYMGGVEKAKRIKKQWNFKAPAPYNRHICRSCAAFTIFSFCAFIAVIITLSLEGQDFKYVNPWLDVAIEIWVLVGFALIAWALFIPQLVREFKLMLHRQDLKGSLLLNIFNICAAILGLAFIIALVVKSLELTSNVGSDKIPMLAKTCIDLGVMGVVIFYMHQYSFMAKNKRYLDAPGILRTKRTLLLTIGFTSLFTLGVLAWWNIVGFEGSFGHWSGMPAYFTLQTLSVFGGTITLLLLVVVLLGIIQKSTDNKDPKFVKHTVVNLIFGVILFVLMILVAARISTKNPKDYSATAYIVFTEIYGILCFVVGIMAFAQSKLIARKPKVVEKK